MGFAIYLLDDPHKPSGTISELEAGIQAKLQGVYPTWESPKSEPGEQSNQDPAWLSLWESKPHEVWVAQPGGLVSIK